MKYTTSRRRFLGAAASTVFAINFVPSRVFGANERIHLAGIGVGGKGAGEINDTSDVGCEIVALCDVDDRRAAETYKKFPNAKRYQDFRVMLEKQKDIDAVTVSTPDHTHFPASMLAMKMGKHVYCQKPLTHTIEEARLMAEAARKYKVVTQMGNQAHAGEPIRRAVEVVRAGIIGKVTEAHIWTNRPIWPQGQTRPEDTPPVPDGLNWDLWLGPAPVRPYHPDYVPFNWRGWWDFGTGALGDMACHIMDMAYWSLDLGAPESVEAESGGGTMESPPNWSVIDYRFPARGDQPPVKLVWYDGKRDGQQNYPPKELIGDVDISRYGTVLVGEKGTMFFNRGSTDWLIKPESILTDFKEPTRTIPRTRNEDYEWVQAIRGEGHQPLSNFERSGPFTETVLLGNLAVRTGKKIQWDSKNLKATNAPEADEFIRKEYRAGWRV